jgi:hypothetical protein
MWSFSYVHLCLLARTNHNYEQIPYLSSHSEWKTCSYNILYKLWHQGKIFELWTYIHRPSDMSELEHIVHWFCFEM